MKEARKQTKIKEQECRWSEGTKQGLGQVISKEVDLEEAMLSPGEEGDVKGYGRVYTKSHEQRGDRSMARAE